MPHCTNLFVPGHMCWYEVCRWGLFSLSVGQCGIVVGQLVKLLFWQLVEGYRHATNAHWTMILDGIAIFVAQAMAPMVTTFLQYKICLLISTGNVCHVDHHTVILCTFLSQRAHDAIITSLWCQNDVATSFWRYFCVVCPLGCVQHSGLAFMSKTVVMGQFIMNVNYISKLLTKFLWLLLWNQNEMMENVIGGWCFTHVTMDQWLPWNSLWKNTWPWYNSIYRKFLMVSMATTLVLPSLFQVNIQIPISWEPFIMLTWHVRMTPPVPSCIVIENFKPIWQTTHKISSQSGMIEKVSFSLHLENCLVTKLIICNSNGNWLLVDLLTTLMDYIGKSWHWSHHGFDADIGKTFGPLPDRRTGNHMENPSFTGPPKLFIGRIFFFYIRIPIEGLLTATFFTGQEDRHTKGFQWSSTVFTGRGPRTGGFPDVCWCNTANNMNASVHFR